jgi:urease accessory protein
VDLGAGSSALVTTPAAGKFYRSAGASAQLVQHLRVNSGAIFEWLPQENIVFDGARIRSVTRVDLEGSGKFIGWEILCLGRPAADERFRRGACHLGFEIYRDGHPLFIEQSRYLGGADNLVAKWGLQGYPVTGTMVCVTRGCNVTETLQSVAAENKPDELFSASQLDEVLICRYLGGSAERARTQFTFAWQHLRRSLLGKAPVLPRIWHT